MISNKIKNHYSKRKAIPVVVIIIVGLVGIGGSMLLEKMRITEYRNSFECKTELEFEFEAFVFEISKNYQRVSFRTIDSVQKSFVYNFETPQEVLKKSFIGQQVIKKTDSTTMAFISRSGKREMLTIPCYQ